MKEVQEGLDRVVCHQDDVFVHAETDTRHDSTLREVLARLSAAGTTLNHKCEFGRDKVLSDNGPQFASAEFQAFAREYGFSPRATLRAMVRQRKP